MKVKELRLENYKKFVHPRTFSFCEGERVNDITLIVGENGSGKSSILQGIAMLVGSAALPFTRPSSLSSNYPGFEYEHISSGKSGAKASAVLQFSTEEIDATLQLGGEVVARLEKDPSKFITPGKSPEIELHLDYQNDKVTSRSPQELFQTKGYQYVLQLMRVNREFESFLDLVGSLYYYHEQRSASSIFASMGAENETRVSDAQFRKILERWYYYHVSLEKGKVANNNGKRDVYADLEGMFQRVFHGRKFKGVTPKMNPTQLMEDEQDFWLWDGQVEYEFSGMSAGERAIFPILVDFANWRINNSIILIDELELHLHPPLQQALIRILPTLGRNNQFIITTHSNDVARMVPESQIIRL